MAIDFDALVLGPAMAVFGGEVTYHPVAGIGSAGFTIADAVFDEAHTVVSFDGEQEVSTVLPVVGVRTAVFADWPGEPQRNAQVTVPGKGIYIVREAQRDGHGHVLLLLNLMQGA